MTITEQARKQLYNECKACLDNRPHGSRDKASARLLVAMFMDNAPGAFPELSEDDLKDIRLALVQRYVL